MSDPSPFPPLPDGALTRDDVVNYLLALKGQGHDIYQDSKNDRVFVLVLNELTRINFNIGKNDTECQVQGIRYNDPLSIADVTSQTQLEQATAAIARTLVGAWPIRPSRGRLSASMLELPIKFAIV